MHWPVCVACVSTKDLQSHHLIPRSHGGSSDATNLITLCGACHGAIHGIGRVGGVGHAGLVSRGKRLAEKAGARHGRAPSTYSDYAASQATRTPRQELWVRLAANERLMGKEIVALKWSDFYLDAIHPCNRLLVLSDHTREQAHLVIKLEEIGPDQMHGSVVATKQSAEGMSANTLNVSLHRLR